MKRILITGGAGFMGSNLTRYIISRFPKYRVTVLDALTNCRSSENFPREIWENPMFSFWHGDVKDADAARNLMRHTDVVIHMAAETRANCLGTSIDTDVKGTQVLLEAVRRHPVERFIHISSSEVYGTAQSLPMTEEHPLLPQSPSAAAKAGADRLAYSFYAMYGIQVTILRPFNNYGPYQYPGKAIPLFITNAIENKPLPVQGDGSFARDWLYVEDFCSAVDATIHADVDKIHGEAINIGTGAWRSTGSIACSILEKLGKSESLIKFVENPTESVRQSVSSTSKAEVLLNWKASVDFNEGLGKTVDWYLDNKSWWEELKK